MDFLNEKQGRVSKRAADATFDSVDSKQLEKRVRRSSRSRGAVPEFTYVNWLDDDWVITSHSRPVHTWTAFVANIGEDNLRNFPLRKQQKNDCSIASAVTAFEVQNRQTFGRDMSSLGAYKMTKEKGGHIRHQIPRVWTRAENIPNRPKDLVCCKDYISLEALVEQVKQGPVCIGVQELGYPWANRALKDCYGPKEKFIPPRFDPYNNPWEHRRRSGADPHAVVIVGMFCSKDVWSDCVEGGLPQRNPCDAFGNVFVTKCTNTPAGWKGSWSKSIGGKVFTPEELSYAMIPADLFTTQIRNGGEARRWINDAYGMKLAPTVYEKLSAASSG